MSDITEKIAWHPAFAAAAGIEFRHEKGLKLIPEYNLSKEPLRIDLYILDEGDEPIRNEVGKIFRRFNIIEYKSPQDELSIDDLF
ncbi:MAG: hypothetical protein Q4E57_04245 [Eubacteriales bacterium]|nr:hypothetical protein [Eubacteriales bacterium]